MAPDHRCVVLHPRRQFWQHKKSAQIAKGVIYQLNGWLVNVFGKTPPEEKNANVKTA